MAYKYITMLGRVKIETGTYKYCHINNISYVFTGNKHHNTVIRVYTILFFFSLKSVHVCTRRNKNS